MQIEAQNQFLEKINIMLFFKFASLGQSYYCLKTRIRPNIHKQSHVQHKTQNAHTPLHSPTYLYFLAKQVTRRDIELINPRHRNSTTMLSQIPTNYNNEN